MFQLYQRDYFNYVLLSFVRRKIRHFAGESNPGPSVGCILHYIYKTAIYVLIYLLK